MEEKWWQKLARLVKELWNDPAGFIEQKLDKARDNANKEDKPQDDVTFIDVENLQHHEELLHTLTSKDILVFNHLGSSYETPFANENELEFYNKMLSQAFGLESCDNVYLYQSGYTLPEKDINVANYHAGEGLTGYENTEMYKLAEDFVNERLLDINGQPLPNPETKLRINILTISYGAISAKQFERSLADIMKEKGFSDEEIKASLAQVAVIAVGDVSYIDKSSDGISFTYMSVIAKNDEVPIKDGHNEQLKTLLSESEEGMLYSLNGGNYAPRLLVIGPSNNEVEDKEHHLYKSYWRLNNSLFPESVINFAQYVIGNNQIKPEEIQNMLNPINIELIPNNEIGQSIEPQHIPEHILQQEVSVTSPLLPSMKSYSGSKGVSTA